MTSPSSLGTTNPLLNALLAPVGGGPIFAPARHLPFAHTRERNNLRDSHKDGILDGQQIAKALGHSMPYQAVEGRWSIERARAWYDELPWLAGCNYYPATAINQIEMWQTDTWDPGTIERELGWCKDLGFNTHRVYLHDLVWAEDETGLYERMDQFLDCGASHGIRPFFVFFDDCHYPAAQLGAQPKVIPAYHNSGWVTCPERASALRFMHGTADQAEVSRLKGYVQQTMARFRDDERVLMWELYNEPGRGAGESGTRHGDLGYEDFGDGSCKLVHASWLWARDVAPSQPICSNTDGCVGSVNWSINALNSDVHSIHNYSPAAGVREQIERFRQDERPLFMTEYLARETGSTFQAVMPVLKEQRVAAINWGFVSGKAGTIWPWSSRHRDGVFRDSMELRAKGEVLAAGAPYPEPELWFHDILRTDGTPFAEEEIACIGALTQPYSVKTPGE